MFSAKDEKNSLGATLWFNIAHYAMRSWPWIVTGLAAVAVYSPHGGLHLSAEFAAEPEKGYVMVLRDFLPPALRGLMVAAFLAAFMSTVGTQLNWGTSYLINDFYRRFIVKKGDEKHYVFVSKLFIVLLVILSGYTAANITSIQSAWQLLLGMGAGTGGVLLLRWYRSEEHTSELQSPCNLVCRLLLEKKTTELYIVPFFPDKICVKQTTLYIQSYITVIKLSVL